MKVIVLDVCQKEISKFPESIKLTLLELINDLSSGLVLSMPVSKRMEGIGRGAYELRLKNTSGIYRVIYLIKKKEAIYLIHAFKKKTTKTPKKNIDLAIKRAKRLL